MLGVLGQLPQHLQVQLPQGAGAGAGDLVVQVELSGGLPGGLAGLPVATCSEAIVSALRSTKDRSGLLATRTSRRGRPLTASPNQTASTNVTCFSRPLNVPS